MLPEADFYPHQWACCSLGSGFWLSVSDGGLLQETIGREEREREREIEKRVRSESLFFFIPRCWITWADYVPLPKVTAPVGGPLSL